MMPAIRAETQVPGILSDEEFADFLSTRAVAESWQLIDGKASLVPPVALRHQLLRSNLALALNAHFDAVRPDLRALQALCLAIPGVRRFRPVADVAVIDSLVELDMPWADRFLLVAEVVSAFNTAKDIETRRRRYVQHPTNHYVVVMAQNEVRIELWARRAQWAPVTLRDLDDPLELPELGLSTTVRTIYAGSGL